DEVRPVPADVRRLLGSARQAALLQPFEVRSSGVDDPAEGDAARLAAGQGRPVEAGPAPPLVVFREELNAHNHVRSSQLAAEGGRRGYAHEIGGRAMQ